MTKKIGLDDLYLMVSNIYSEQNYQRSESKTFSHFVEVCGMLTAPARGKKREVDFESALCKAFGWFFPLMAKCKVRSIEEIVFRKYPNVCPYCRESPHQEANCKNIKGSDKTVNHNQPTGQAPRPGEMTQKKPPQLTLRGLRWLGYRDSNPDRQSQNLQSYR